MSEPVQAMAKGDLVVAGAVMTWSAGAAGLTLLEKLQAVQIIVAIVVSLIGGAYLVWRWHKDYRHSKRRNRRQDD